MTVKCDGFFWLRMSTWSQYFSDVTLVCRDAIYKVILAINAEKKKDLANFARVAKSRILIFFGH